MSAEDTLLSLIDLAAGDDMPLQIARANTEVDAHSGESIAPATAGSSGGVAGAPVPAAAAAAAAAAKTAPPGFASFSAVPAAHFAASAGAGVADLTAAIHAATAGVDGLSLMRALTDRDPVDNGAGAGEGTGDGTGNVSGLYYAPSQSSATGTALEIDAALMAEFGGNAFSPPQGTRDGSATSSHGSTSPITGQLRLSTTGSQGRAGSAGAPVGDIEDTDDDDEDEPGAGAGIDDPFGLGAECGPVPGLTRAMTLEAAHGGAESGISSSSAAAAASSTLVSAAAPPPVFATTVSVPVSVAATSTSTSASTSVTAIPVKAAGAGAPSSSSSGVDTLVLPARRRTASNPDAPIVQGVRAWPASLTSANNAAAVAKAAVPAGCVLVRTPSTHLVREGGANDDDGFAAAPQPFSGPDTAPVAISVAAVSAAAQPAKVVSGYGAGAGASGRSAQSKLPASGASPLGGAFAISAPVGSPVPPPSRQVSGTGLFGGKLASDPFSLPRASSAGGVPDPSDPALSPSGHARPISNSVVAIPVPVGSSFPSPAGSYPAGRAASVSAAASPAYAADLLGGEFGSDSIPFGQLTRALTSESAHGSDHSAETAAAAAAAAAAGAGIPAKPAAAAAAAAASASNFFYSAPVAASVPGAVGVVVDAGALDLGSDLLAEFGAGDGDRPSLARALTSCPADEAAATAETAPAATTQ